MRGKKIAGYRHGDLRRALIDASGDVITQNGIDALTLHTLAAICTVLTTSGTRRASGR
jgi:AcrR family transcriptional regulator